MQQAPQIDRRTLTPLVVDLDGTLLRGDLLHESVFALLRKSPLCVFRLPFWLRQGKARLKHEIARRIDLDVSTLPYNEQVLEYLRQESARGRSLILATASNERLAHQVASHLEFFDEVLASDERVNLKAETKLARVREHLDGSSFDYIGDSMADLPLWHRAERAIVVGDRGLADTVRRQVTVETHIPVQRPRLSVYASALRTHQWLKNLLVFVPLIAAHRFSDLPMMLELVLAFLAFSLCASSVYVLNDLIDLGDDRQHPRKRFRPFASGELSIARGCIMVPGLLGAAVAIALWLPLTFLATLAVYYATTLAYSLSFKRLEVLDIITLATLYTLRIIGGGAATGIPLTVWLLGFSLFVFMSLAVAKRCAELIVMRELGRNEPVGRGYRVRDLPLLCSVGVGAGYVAALVLTLYLTSYDVRIAYSNPVLLWVFCPMLLYWITRVWLKTYRGEMHDDPVVFAVRDGGSRILAVIGGMALWLAV